MDFFSYFLELKVVLSYDVDQPSFLVKLSVFCDHGAPGNRVHKIYDKEGQSKVEV